MKILKYILVGLCRILYSLIILFLFFLLVVSRPNFMFDNIEQLLNARLPPGMSVSGSSLSKIELSLRSVAIRDIQFTFKKAETVYKVSAEAFFLPDMSCVVSATECPLFIKNANIESADVMIKGVEGDFMVSLKPGEWLAQGSAVIESSTYKEYTVDHIYSDVSITGQAVAFERASAHAYRGWLTAKGTYQFLPKEKIDVAVDFQGIDTHLMDGVNLKLKGVLAGKAVYTGTLKRIDSFTAEFRSPSSEIEKTLFKYLMGDINNSLAFLPFSKILDGMDFIHLENFQGTVHNLDQDSVSIQMNVRSKEPNLNLNPDITINLR